MENKAKQHSKKKLKRFKNFLNKNRHIFQSEFK